MNSPHADLTVLVNSSDAYADCWEPFFVLFARYWPDCSYPVVLNTEIANPTFPLPFFRASCSALGATRRLTWSESLQRCLKNIDTPYVLYLQEDYFLEAPVNIERVEQMLDYLRTGVADVIRLHECEGSGPWHPSAFPDLWQIDKHSRYLLALQAGLWRKDVLEAQLRSHESPWQLEIFGSRRARRKNYAIFCVNRDRYSGSGKEIFPYTATGVVGAKWSREIVVPLFSRHGIAIDYNVRGFHVPGPAGRQKPPLLSRVLDRLRSLF